MTNTREQMLARLRTNPLGEVPAPELEVRRFAWSLDEAVEKFELMLKAVRAEVYHVGHDWPCLLAEQLTQAGARNLYYGPEGPLSQRLTRGWPETGPQLAALDRPIEETRETLFDQADAGFTSCVAGIAETGSLVLWPTPAEPRLLSLVPPIHCVLIERDQIRSTLHELIVQESWCKGMPTNALLISGPSKSADIEQTLAYGVHGPERLLVLIQ
ncbi:lactate utilization protein [Thiorhodococcus mannitoliphagus]|uniref:Lactate utilization protein n=1 Tax=Thiorhodococcus mannitoliphagus TaxID=329406 RepID=A0A6P1DQC9_9GAMM|nr:lactate utilization protein [Thiorhodococcus mannitoliphagus]NEX19131.1 lactate utilization protein [Thiorhodococcus mannitoliphagus]